MSQAYPRTCAKFPASCGQQQCLCPRGPRGPPGPAGDIDWGVDAIAATRQSLVTLSLGYDTDGTETGAGWFISSNIIMTAWSFLAQQAQGIRVLVTLPTFVISVDGVLVEAVPTLGVAFVHVNPALFKCTGFAPPSLTIATNPVAGQTVFVYPAPSRTGFAAGTIAQASYGTTGYTTGILVSNVDTALYGSAVIRASDYAIVGMVQYALSGSSVLYALHGALLQFVLARYGLALIPNPAVAPGFAKPPVLRRSLALAQGVVGGGDLTEGVVYVPMVTAAVNPALTTYFEAETQDAGGILTLGAPATGAWVYRPDFDGVTARANAGDTAAISCVADLNAVLATAATGKTMVAADVGFASTVLSAAAFTATWHDTASDANVSALADVLVAAPHPVKTVTTSAASYAIADNGGAGPQTLPFMLIYEDLGMVVFTNSLSNPDVPQWSALRTEIAAPGTLTTVPYLAPFACLDLAAVYAEGTYWSAKIGGLTVGSTSWIAVTWETTGTSLTEQIHVQVQYCPATGEVLYLYRTLPGTWPTKQWLTATTMTATFDPLVPEVVVGTQVLRVVAQPQPLQVVYFGLASAYSNAAYVALPGADTVGVGAVAPVRLPDGSRVRTVLGTLALLATSDPAARVTAASYLFLWTWPTWDSPMRVMSVSGAPVGQSNVNDASLAVVLAGVAPLASALLPTSVAVSAATIGYVGAPTSMDRPSDLWTTIRAGLGVAPALTSVVSAANLYFDFSDARALGTYGAEAFMYQGTLGLNTEGDLVSVALKYAEPQGGAVDGDTFIIQLAASDSSALTTRFDVITADPDRTCAVLVYASGAWTLTYYDYYLGAVKSSGPYVPGVDPITLVYTPDSNISQRVNTLLVGLPPTFGTPPLPADTQLVNGTLSITDVKWQVLGAYSATVVDKAYAITTDVDNL